MSHPYVLHVEELSVRAEEEARRTGRRRSEGKMEEERRRSEVDRLQRELVAVSDALQQAVGMRLKAQRERQDVLDQHFVALIPSALGDLDPACVAGSHAAPDRLHDMCPAIARPPSLHDTNVQSRGDTLRAPPSGQVKGHRVPRHNVAVAHWLV
ncbi:unnamed protein product [Arctogadus glacialis]